LRRGATCVRVHSGHTQHCILCVSSHAPQRRDQHSWHVTRWHRCAKASAASAVRVRPSIPRETVWCCDTTAQQHPTPAHTPSAASRLPHPAYTPRHYAPLLLSRGGSMRPPAEPNTNPCIHTTFLHQACQPSSPHNHCVRVILRWYPQLEVFGRRNRHIALAHNTHALPVGISNEQWAQGAPPITIHLTVNRWARPPPPPSVAATRATS
jgi:hypothetical protein